MGYVQDHVRGLHLTLWVSWLEVLQFVDALHQLNRKSRDKLISSLEVVEINNGTYINHLEGKVVAMLN
jgi:hypothetical protein